MPPSRVLSAKTLKEITMTKRFFLVLLAMLLVLSVFTACDDDDDDDKSTDSTEESRACTEEDYEIIYAIVDACAEGMITEDGGNVDSDYSTFTSANTDSEYATICTFNTYTCTVTSRIDGSEISVTIESGSTYTYVIDSSFTSMVDTYNISATVDGTSRSLYMVETTDFETYESTTSIELDGVELTGFDDIASSLAE